MLCKICLNIDIDALIVDFTGSLNRLKGHLRGYKHHVNFRKLVESAQQRCELCQQIVNRFRRSSEYISGRESFFDEQIYCGIVNQRLGIPQVNKGGSELCFFWNIEGTIIHIAQLGLYIKRNSAASQDGTDLISGRETSDNSKSDECFAVARGFLNECLQNHPLCHPDMMPYPSLTNAIKTGSGSSTPDTRWPTRTIDVGSPDGTSEPFLSVNDERNTLSFQDAEVSRSWVALSHCWGGHFPIMTTTENIHKMEKAIPMSILPPLFQDAVLITRRLGFRQLWIDSLCIIQDSAEDWDREVTQMGNIYARSVLNIAADSSKNCCDSILGQRHLAFPPIKIAFHSHNHQIDGEMFVRPCLDSWKDVLLYGSNLSSRAWVLQESMLASRTLHFYKQQMLWECRSLQIAESCLTPTAAPTGLQKKHQDDWSLNKRFLSSVIMKDETGSAGKARDIIFLQWYTVVENYSLRNLTISNDRLPALASLACCFRDLLKESYHCGLFAGDLHRGLLWQTQDRVSARYAASYRAPSWSWASVDGPVKYHFLAIRGAPRQCHAEVLQVETIFRNRRLEGEENDLPETEDGIDSPYSIPEKGTTDIDYGEVFTRATTVLESDVHSQIVGGFIILCGPWRAADEWNTVLTYEDSLSLKDKDHDDGTITCHFDIASPAKIEQWSQTRNTYGFLHISSMGIPTRNEGQVMTLILELTLRDPDECRRVGIAFMDAKMLNSATQSWRKRTVKII